MSFVYKVYKLNERLDIRTWLQNKNRLGSKISGDFDIETAAFVQITEELSNLMLIPGINYKLTKNYLMSYLAEHCDTSSNCFLKVVLIKYFSALIYHLCLNIIYYVVEVRGFKV